MSVHLHRRKGESSKWQALVYLNRRRYRFSCRTDDKSTARDYAHQRAAELKARHDRGLVGLPEPVRLSDVLRRYMQESIPKLRPESQRRTLGIVAQLRGWFLATPLSDPLVAGVRPNDIAAFLEKKQSEGVSPRTVNLYRATLHRILRLCVRPCHRLSCLLPGRGVYDFKLNPLTRHDEVQFQVGPGRSQRRCLSNSFELRRIYA